MQNIWDSNKGESKINLIVCGSVYSMMKKIFEDDKEPLFGRATGRINLTPFSPSVCKKILSDYNKNYTKRMGTIWVLLRGIFEIFSNLFIFFQI